MGDLFRVDYSSLSIRDVVREVEEIKRHLSKLSDELEYDENTQKGGINLVAFRKLQVEFEFRLDQVLRNYALLFIFRFGWPEFMSWRGKVGKLVSGRNLNSRVSSINADALPVDDRDKAKLRNIPPYLMTLFETKVWTQDWIDKLSAEHGRCHDVFLSSSSEDGAEAQQIVDSIKKAEGKVFHYEVSVKGGEDFVQKIIREALPASRELWLLLSPDSLNSSWVVSEWGAALALGKRVVPILLRCEPENVPEQLRHNRYIRFKDYHSELIETTFPGCPS